MSRSKRVLVVGLDGLRPDMVRPDVMPTLSRLTAAGTLFSQFYATYPPVTRSCAASFSTGVRPGRHGMVNNAFHYAGLGADGYVDAGADGPLGAFSARAGQPVLLAPSLGTRLAEVDRKLAVASCSSAGASLFWQTHDPAMIINPASQYGRSTLTWAKDLLGPVPKDPPGTKLGRVDWVTRALTELLLPTQENSALLLWLGEPDETQHHHGLGSPEAVVAMKAVDSCLQHVMSRVDSLRLSDEFNLLVVSDHGHSHVLPAPQFDALFAQLCSTIGVDSSRFRVVGDFIYGLHEKSVKGDELRRLSDWLQQQPWCDVVFAHPSVSADLPGTFDLSLVMGPITHDRAPLLAISPRWTTELNGYGVDGGVHAIAYGDLKSAHGAASPYELRAFCLGYGPAFRCGHVVSVATGVVDVAPTVFELLGLDVPEGFDGDSLLTREENTETEYMRDGLAISCVNGSEYFKGSLRGGASALRNVTVS